MLHLQRKTLSQLFEFKTKQEIYNLILFPGDYFEVVSVNLTSQRCRYTMLSSAQLDRQIKDSYVAVKKLFSADNTSSLEQSYQKKIRFCERILKKDADQKEFKQTNHEDRNKKEQLAQQNKFYKQKIVDVCDQNKKLSIQLGKKQDSIGELKVQMQLLKINYDQIAKKLSRIQWQFKERSYHQRRQSEFVTQMQQNITYKIPLKSIQHIKTIQHMKSNGSFKFTPFANQFLKNFNIEGSKIKLVKQFKDFSQVSSNSALPLKGKITIKLKIVQTKGSNIYFGVISQPRRKQKFTCQHKQAISYKLKGGKFLYEDGVQTGQDIPWVKQGQQLNLMIDSSAQQVSWSLEQKYMIKRKLPESLQKSPLYVFASLHDEGDQIELI